MGLSVSAWASHQWVSISENHRDFNKHASEETRARQVQRGFHQPAA